MLKSPSTMPWHNNRGAALPHTHRHGVVEGVVVDAGAQWIIQHAIFKQLQSFCHFFMEVICRFIRTCKVEIVGVQPVNKTDGSFYPPGMWNRTICVTMEINKQLCYFVRFIETPQLSSSLAHKLLPTTPAPDNLPTLHRSTHALLDAGTVYTGPRQAPIHFFCAFLSYGPF